MLTAIHGRKRNEMFLIVIMFNLLLRPSYHQWIEQNEVRYEKFKIDCQEKCKNNFSWLHLYR